MTTENKTLIQIMGPSFCGSSFTGMCLGALDGAAFIGESYCVDEIHDPYWEKAFGSPLLELDPPRPGIPCQPCEALDRPCSFFTKDRICRARKEGRRWFRFWADEFGVDTLVASDKLPIRFVDKTDGMDCSLLIMFRSPESGVASIMKHGDGMIPAETAVGWYASLYKQVIEYADGKRRMYVDFDALLGDEEKWSEISRFCGLAWNPWAIRYWEHEQHVVGGNSRAADQYRPGSENERLTAIEHEWKARLTANQISIIRGSREANDLYSRMVANAWRPM